MLTKSRMVLVMIAAGMLSCSDQSLQVNSPDEKMLVSDEEKFAIDTLLALPEVVKRNQTLEKISGGKSRLTAHTVLRPDLYKDYYWIEILESAEEKSVCHFNFYYYPSTREIKYLDTEKEQLLTLPQLRKDTLPRGVSHKEGRDYNF